MANVVAVEKLENAIRAAIQTARWEHMKPAQIKVVVETALLKEDIDFSEGP